MGDALARSAPADCNSREIDVLKFGQTANHVFTDKAHVPGKIEALDPNSIGRLPSMCRRSHFRRIPCRITIQEVRTWIVRECGDFTQSEFNTVWNSYSDRSSVRIQCCLEFVLRQVVRANSVMFGIQEKRRGRNSWSREVFHGSMSFALPC